MDGRNGNLRTVGEARERYCVGDVERGEGR